jgi:hypothetical protein
MTRLHIGQLEQLAAIVPLTAGKYHGAGENAVKFEIRAKTNAILADPGRLKIFGSNQISRGRGGFRPGQNLRLPADGNDCTTV